MHKTCHELLKELSRLAHVLVLGVVVCLLDQLRVAKDQLLALLERHSVSPVCMPSDGSLPLVVRMVTVPSGSKIP